MKAIKSLILVLVAVLALASCSKGDGYRNVIPVNSPFVASVDMASIAEKSDFANSSVSGMIKQYMGAIFDGKAGKQVEKYMESPQDMGIDFRSPVYIFQTPNRCYGLTMKMLDKGDFEDFLNMLQKQNVASKAKERDGVMEGTFLDDIVYGYDDNTILILAAEEGVATSRRTLTQLFTLDSDDRYARTDGFSYLFDHNDKDIAILSNMAALPQDLASSLKSLIPQGVKMTDVQLEATADFQNGKLVLGGALVPTTEKAGEMLREAEKNFHKIKGDFFDTALDCFPIWACMGVDGEWLLGKLKQDTSIKQLLFMLERGIDVEAMIRAIDGDVAIALPSATSYDDFMIKGKLKNDDFLADVPDWQEGMKDYGISMQKKGQDEYLLQADGMNINWGVKDENLYLLTYDTMLRLNTKPAKANDVVKSNRDEVTNSLAYMCVDLQSIISPIVQASSAIGISPEGIAIMKLCSKFKNLIVKFEPESRVEIRVELDDEKDNFLKALMK